MKNRLRVCLASVALLTLVSVAHAQVVAETIGFNTRDRQLYGPAVRFIAFDSLSGTHAVWKDGYGSIRYNFRPRSGGWRWPGGMVINVDPRNLGSMDIDVSQGSAMIAADHLYRNTHVLTRLADTGPGTGAFFEEEIGGDCRYALVGAANFGYYKFAALSNDSLFYRAYFAVIPVGHVGAFPAFNLAVSKQSGRYSFVWAETEGPDRGTLFLKETPNNGQNWFETSRLSDSVPSPLSRSLLSGCGTYDTIRIHLLADFYDGSDVLHSQIWHYAKYPAPSWHIVHDYTCPSGTRLGDDALAADRPSIGMNRALGELYAVWEQFDPDNVDPATGLCRADIWAARTIDSSYNWGPALRLTRPDSTSKRFPFLSEVVNDTLHIIYFADQVAGFSEQGQGPQTSNAVICLRVPVNMLPTGIADSKTLHARHFTLNAFPNPFRGTTTIRLSGSPFVPNPSSFTVRVFDAAGRLVESASLGPKLPLAVSFGGSVRPGIYFATLGTGPGAATCRIVKTP
ncbi:MAG: T9SS type A sorting domain-containing protein [candidate division WOR-3 bacterium]|nr:T9SS type A sorting domain-containing protein [candidate division WOR-3 bacterium]